MSAKKVDKYETLLAVGLDLKDILFSSTASMMMQQIWVFYLILRGTFESSYYALDGKMLTKGNWQSTLKLERP